MLTDAKSNDQAANCVRIHLGEPAKKSLINLAQTLHAIAKKRKAALAARTGNAQVNEGNPTDA